MTQFRLAIAAVTGALWLASCTTAPNTHAPPPKPFSVAPARPSLPQPPFRAAAGLHVNAAGLQIIKESEGLHLAAYRDNGQWLIGYGHAAGAYAGARISAERAEDLLKQDVALCESAVGAALRRPATPNQFSALVSLCYNIGHQRLANSSIVKRFNEGDVQGAADGFLDWARGTVNGEKVVLPRLEDRRKKERALFLAV